MLRLKEVASQSQTFPKRALEKQNVNRTLLLPRPATGRTLQLFSIDRPPLLAVRRRVQRYSAQSFGFSVDWTRILPITHNVQHNKPCIACRRKNDCSQGGRRCQY